jgi:hypothetical protein
MQKDASIASINQFQPIRQQRAGRERARTTAVGNDYYMATLLQNH